MRNADPDAAAGNEKLTSSQLMDLVALKNDIEAFEVLYRQTREFVFGRFCVLLHGMGRGSDEAVDLTLQFFNRIYRRRSTWGVGRSYESWAWVIINNLAVDHWRQNHKWWEMEHLDEPDLNGMIIDPPGSGLSPHEETERELMRLHIKECLGLLSQKARDALKQHLEAADEAKTGERSKPKGRQAYDDLYKAKAELRKLLAKRGILITVSKPERRKKHGEAEDGRS